MRVRCSDGGGGQEGKKLRFMLSLMLSLLWRAVKSVLGAWLISVNSPIMET